MMRIHYDPVQQETLEGLERVSAECGCPLAEFAVLTERCGIRAE